MSFSSLPEELQHNIAIMSNSIALLFVCKSFWKCSSLVRHIYFNLYILHGSHLKNGNKEALASFSNLDLKVFKVYFRGEEVYNVLCRRFVENITLSKLESWPKKEEIVFDDILSVRDALVNKFSYFFLPNEKLKRNIAKDILYRQCGDIPCGEDRILFLNMNLTVLRMKNDVITEQDVENYISASNFGDSYQDYDRLIEIYKNVKFHL